MVIKKKREVREGRMVFAVFAGTLCFCIALIVLLFLAAWVIFHGALKEEVSGILTMISLLISSFFAEFVALKARQGNYVVTTSVTLFVLVILLITTNIIMFDGGMESFMRCSMAIALGSLAMLLLFTTLNGKRKIVRSVNVYK